MCTLFHSYFLVNRIHVPLESAVREPFIKREHLVSVYFYIEKAYDTTWRYGVMKDLHETGLRGKMPIFIAKFLINTKMFSSNWSTQFSQE